jgi:diacylglycerol kinase (ATP)
MLKKRLDSFRYAISGIAVLLRTQANARIHLAVTCAVVVAGVFFQISVTEWCLVVLAIALVFSAEAFNTALEYLTDLVSPGVHPIAGKAKDLAAGAVLIAAMGAALVGTLIFLPKFFTLVHF